MIVLMHMMHGTPLSTLSHSYLYCHSCAHGLCSGIGLVMWDITGICIHPEWLIVDVILDTDEADH